MPESSTMSQLLVVPAQGDTLQSPASLHFGRAPYFVFVDLATGAWDASPNPGASAPRHPGLHAAQVVTARGASAVAGHHLGQHPVMALERAGVAIHEGMADVPVETVVARFREGGLRRLTAQEILVRRHTEGCDAPRGRR